MQEFHTTDDIAKRLFLNVQTIRRWHREGQLVGYRFGRRLLFKSEDVLLLIAKRFNKPKPNSRTS
jgi:excisionase family DNA binding protein